MYLEEESAKLQFEEVNSSQVVKLELLLLEEAALVTSECPSLVVRSVKSQSVVAK